MKGSTQRPKSASAGFRSKKIAPSLEKPWETLTAATPTLVAGTPIASKKTKKELREDGWNDHTKVRGTNEDMMSSGRLIKYLDLIPTNDRPKSAAHSGTNKLSRVAVTSDSAPEISQLAEQLAQQLKALQMSYAHLKLKYGELAENYGAALSEIDSLAVERDSLAAENARLGEIIKEKDSDIAAQGQQILKYAKTTNEAHSRATTPIKSRTPNVGSRQGMQSPEGGLASRFSFGAGSFVDDEIPKLNFGIQIIEEGEDEKIIARNLSEESVSSNDKIPGRSPSPREKSIAGQAEEIKVARKLSDSSVSSKGSIK